MNLRQISRVAASLALLLSSATSLFAQEKVSAFATKMVSLNSTIQKKHAKWVAVETSVSQLSPVELKYLVGFNNLKIKAEPVPEMQSLAAPASVDWRDNGFVTPVRDQKKCGSCWAFAMTGALESNVIIAKDKPSQNLDLSEQVFISCGGVGSCNGGTLNADYLVSSGLPPEKYYPYAAVDGDCSSAQAGWEKAAEKIGSWGSVSAKLSSIKSALAKYGPLPTAMWVYEDFMHYKTGVYSYVSGKKLGGHAILLVGYNDGEQYFIVKNSWNTKWGEDGYFKIAYSELTSDVSFGMMTLAYRPATDLKSIPPRIEPVMMQRP